jgi:hypothetical protein
MFLGGRCHIEKLSCFGISSTVISKSQVCVASGHLALDIVALAEEREPVVKNLYVLWFEIFPLWSTFLLLQGRLCESSGCVFAGKHWEQGSM